MMEQTSSVTNPKLPRDYLVRSRKRLKAIGLLIEEEAFPDVVRESQEVVELLLKAVLRSFGIPVPFGYDVSEALAEYGWRLPSEAGAHVPRWAQIFRNLRRSRELAFYGSEDVTPSTFYTRADAEEAKAMAEEILVTAEPWIT
jgi:HEPN domain-containing protein